MIWLLALLAPLQLAGEAAASDPRIEWVELQRAGRLREALASVERRLLPPAAEPPPAGTHYLRGRLLAALGSRDRATSALAATLGREPELASWARLGLAEVQIADGHPEVAAGLLASLLASPTDETLESLAVDLLAGALDSGGDCRLLASLDGWSLAPASRRRLRVRRSDCLREQAPVRADAELVALLADDTTDGAALEAAERLAAAGHEPGGETALEMAMAFYGQRSFDAALSYFSAALAPGALPAARRADYDTYYALARTYFWLGDYRRAAARFADLVALAGSDVERARAHYQRGRCFELAGSLGDADAAFRDAHDADPTGSWAAAALTSRLRISWLGGDESGAIELLDRLSARRHWHGMRALAALFLAAGDLVAERGDRAAAWLDLAAASPSTHLPELAYWRGRLAEVQGDPRRAVGHYREVLVTDSWDAWAEEARRRLRQPGLAAEVARAVVALADSPRQLDLLAASLLDPAHPAAASAHSALRSRLERHPSRRDFMRLAALPTAAWPLWQAPLSSTEEVLLAVGDWRAAMPAIERHFPLSDDRLALTRARILAEGGLIRPSILAAEVLARRTPGSLPPSLWPDELTRSLYPLAFGDLIRREALARGLEPMLLAALIREESRFDARATSAAAARGLTQFVLPTARRVAGELGIDGLAADDLHSPEIAVRLGAAYLAELGARFDGREHQMLAAYNAGEEQTELWHRYCNSDERSEFLTKVGFRETRRYLRKVLASYGRYREIYGESREAATSSGRAPGGSSK